jgi:archaellum component FlaC
MPEKLEENDEEIKKLKADVVSQVNTMIAKHEKTFDSILEKINLAIRKMENELQKEESLYEKMETAKRFMENYSPPDPPKLDPPKRANGFDFPAFQPKSPAPQQSIPPAPAPERFERSLPETFIYEPGAPIASPTSIFRRSTRKAPDMDDLDDDMDVDDLISGNMKGFKDSVNSMNMNVAGITEKLASIEDKVAKMQTVKNPSLERLDDKIRMYSESVTGMHSRMETVEKALRDGMTPMMESLKLLTETVKTLKEDSKPAVRKPTPPKKPKKELV